MSPREKRILQNEALFREVNKRIAELDDRISAPGDLLPLICECANIGCTTVIEVDGGTFKTVRKNLLLFLVARGHETDDETVIGSGTGYFIVEKPDPSQ
jgi:hypothetical protein